MFIEYYFKNCLGYIPQDKTTINKLENIISYLQDCNIDNDLIYKYLDDLQFDKISFDLLPDYLWKNSLLKPNTFYFHKSLQIIKGYPTWNVFQDIDNSKIKDNIEMKIIFTLDNLIEYYYENFYKDIELRDYKKDIGSFKYLLTKYSKLTYIEPIDFILYLIDNCKNEESVLIRDILDITKLEDDTAKYLKRITNNAKAKRKDKVKWRT